MTAPVALVGGGPGDPGLLTLRAEALLAAAEVVVVDRALVPLASAHAVRARLVVLDEGPGRVDGAVALVSAAAAAAATSGGAAVVAGAVVRLYRGDPWLHPAHGAESAALRRAGVSFEVVPGVATEVALPARAGIPVHHRRLAVTAIFADDMGVAPAPVDPARTLVVSVMDLRATAARLAAASATAGGSAATMPSAALASGTVRRAPLDVLAAEAPVASGLLVCGAVCAVDLGGPGDGPGAPTP